MFKKIILPTISLFVICGVAALLLALTNQTTKDIIIKGEAQNAQEAQSKVMEMAENFEDKTVNFDGKEYTYQLAHGAGDEVVGYVFTTSANGYGGQIRVMTGVSADGTVNKVEILSVEKETPGLGQNATNESFYSQYSGKSSIIEAVKGEASGNQIKALTGATITSKAVTKAVNEALTLYDNVIGGGQ